MQVTVEYKKYGQQYVVHQNTEKNQALLSHEESQMPIIMDSSMIKEKINTEEETLSMNGWDTFVDQYLTEKRNLEKQKCGLPFMSK